MHLSNFKNELTLKSNLDDLEKSLNQAEVIVNQPEIPSEPKETNTIDELQKEIQLLKEQMKNQQLEQNIVRIEFLKEGSLIFRSKPSIPMKFNQQTMTFQLRRIQILSKLNRLREIWGKIGTIKISLPQVLLRTQRKLSW